jgi:hypothetical protein
VPEKAVKSDHALRALVAAIVIHDVAAVGAQLAASPQLTTASFEAGATRSAAKQSFISAVMRYIVAGDTALHFAAAAYAPDIARTLLAAGANVRSRNRHGYEPLHAAAAACPGSPRWNPTEQAATIRFLIGAGADPNAVDKRGVTPLHIAVRTRCAAAVRTLIQLGADPSRPNGNGSTPMLLAQQNTGRGGTGLPEAKEQQREILSLLRQAERLG